MAAHKKSQQFMMSTAGDASAWSNSMAAHKKSQEFSMSAAEDAAGFPASYSFNEVEQLHVKHADFCGAVLTSS